ncbi:TetR/AcrR family transcriptional regulator [Clostridium ganghwense]|uniref:TetR/AcrR family transcriptional regulator n=1 Tax=Clostridium ganghwense TaxID=312089 RepID=A0ABT4CUB2_9CLOT|nr:TetR/AcrR family transcriptional regulator [Clostridium ganghwense]MCY6371641.1 TetR/AcrR family transcriptional regulator [Clostridium ganghwense]
MPKIIKGIEEKIFNAGMNLFGEKGYSNVDMKMIAKEADIAVGTLYNYYSNKKQLYIKVFEVSWKYTFSKLDTIIESSIPLEEKIEGVVITLYEEIERKKGIGQELTKENVFDKNKGDGMSWIKNELIRKMEFLIMKLKIKYGIKLEEGMEGRFVETMLILINEMSKEHPDEKEKNIKYINQILQLIYVK